MSHCRETEKRFMESDRLKTDQRSLFEKGEDTILWKLLVCNVESKGILNSRIERDIPARNVLSGLFACVDSADSSLIEHSRSISGGREERCSTHECLLRVCALRLLRKILGIRVCNCTQL